jgi:hypothetical protein
VDLTGDDHLHPSNHAATFCQEIGSWVDRISRDPLVESGKYFRRFAVNEKDKQLGAAKWLKQLGIPILVCFKVHYDSNWRSMANDFEHGEGDVPNFAGLKVNCHYRCLREEGAEEEWRRSISLK